MIFSHQNFLNYDLPDDWCEEETDENLLIYNPTGEGAITISFFNILDMKETLDEHISILAKSFIDENEITLHNPLILYGNKETKTCLCGTGTTSDDWFIKLWIVAKYPKIVFATYQSEKRTSELKKVDAIIKSIEFLF